MYCVLLQDLCQAALQQSPCPLASTPDCPALPTPEGAEAALKLLTAACTPWRWRWCIDHTLSLSQRLKRQVQSQGMAPQVLRALRAAG